MTDYYVLQISTGRELAVRDDLIAAGFDARVPREIALLRKGGKWHEVERALMPGYVFCAAQMCAETWHMIMRTARRSGGIARLLGAPTPILPAEAVFLGFLTPTPAPISPSVVEFDSFGAPRIVSGTLADIKGSVVRIHKRQRRATVQMSIYGKPRTMDMAILPVEASHKETSNGQR